jgi:hypothetical protein
MAIFLAGKSRCRLCGQIIESLVDVVATPPFLRATHRLANFSDAVFHRECFEHSPDHAEVERLLTKFKDIMKDAPPTIEGYEQWVAKALKEFG